MGRTIGAAVAGFVAIGALVLITDQIAAALMPELFPDVMAGEDPTMGGISVNLAYGFVYAIFGGWLTAVIARDDQRRAVNILLGLIAVFGVISGVSTSRALPDVMPVWYYAGVVILGVIGAFLGGRWAASRSIQGA